MVGGFDIDIIGDETSMKFSMEKGIQKIILILAVLCFAIFVTGCGKEKNYLNDSVLKNCEKLDKDYNADLMIWNADGVELSEKLNYSSIEGNDLEGLKTKANSGYGCIIIINRNGSIELTGNMVQTLKEFSEANHYDIFYYGTKDNDKFIEHKLVKSFLESDRGFFYIVSNKDVGEYNAAGNPNAAHGLWDTQHEELQAEDTAFLQYDMLNDLCYFAQKAENYKTGKQ